MFVRFTLPAGSWSGAACSRPHASERSITPASGLTNYQPLTYFDTWGSAPVASDDKPLLPPSVERFSLDSCCALIDLRSFHLIARSDSIRLLHYDPLNPIHVAQCCLIAPSSLPGPTRRLYHNPSCYHSSRSLTAGEVSLNSGCVVSGDLLRQGCAKMDRSTLLCG